MLFFNIRNICIWIFLNLHHIHSLQYLGWIDNATIILALPHPLEEKINFGANMPIDRQQFDRLIKTFELASVNFYTWLRPSASIEGRRHSLFRLQSKLVILLVVPSALAARHHDILTRHAPGNSHLLLADVLPDIFKLFLTTFDIIILVWVITSSIVVVMGSCCIILSSIAVAL